jgi:hypothetical protein
MQNLDNHTASSIKIPGHLLADIFQRLFLKVRRRLFLDQMGSESQGEVLVAHAAAKQLNALAGGSGALAEFGVIPDAFQLQTAGRASGQCSFADNNLKRASGALLADEFADTLSAL